jgi:hypothetical protein
MLLLTLFVIGLSIFGIAAINRKKKGQLFGLIVVIVSVLGWIVLCVVNSKIEDETINTFSAKTMEDQKFAEEMTKIPVGEKVLGTSVVCDSSWIRYNVGKIDEWKNRRLPAGFNTLKFYREHPRLVFWVSIWPDPTRKFEAISQWMDNPFNGYPAQILGPVKSD